MSTDRPTEPRADRLAEHVYELLVDKSHLKTHRTALSYLIAGWLASPEGLRVLRDTLGLVPDAAEIYCIAHGHEYRTVAGAMRCLRCGRKPREDGGSDGP